MRVLAAALLVLAASLANAGDAKLTWTLATQNTDGTAIPATGPERLAATRLEWGSCDGAGFGIQAGEQIAPVPVTEYTVTGLAAGEHCFRAYSQLANGAESVPTNVVRKTIEPAIPEPPGNLTVISPVVFQVIGTPNKFAFIPVGQTLPGTVCDREQTVNGYFAVPRESVSWYGSVQPQVVVAKCG